MNPNLHERSFYLEGVLTAFLEQGEVLSIGVGASPPAVYCKMNEGAGGWQKKDGRWFYAHHAGLTLNALATRFGTDVMTVWKGSKNAGTIPTTWGTPQSKFNVNNPPVFYPSGTNLAGVKADDRVLFWMPDAAIEKAYADGCIQEKGDLGGPKPLVASSGLTVKCAMNLDGTGGWQLAEDGRWYFVHYPALLLGDLAEVYLGSSSRAKEIFNGSQSRGLLPFGSTIDNVPLQGSVGPTFFWMPDDGILKAYSLGCIPEVGNLSQPKPEMPECPSGGKASWNAKTGAWDCPAPCLGGRLFAKDGITCICPDGMTPINPQDPKSPCKPINIGPINCKSDEVLDPQSGTCKPKNIEKPNSCPNGMVRNTSGECVSATCPPDQEMNLKGQCVPKKSMSGPDKPSSEKEEESSPMWPWVLLALGIVGGGGYMIYSARQNSQGKDTKPPSKPGDAKTPQKGMEAKGSTSPQPVFRGSYPSSPPPNQSPTVLKTNPVGMPEGLILRGIWLVHSKNKKRRLGLPRWRFSTF